MEPPPSDPPPTEPPPQTPPADSPAPTSTSTSSPTPSSTKKTTTITPTADTTPPTISNIVVTKLTTAEATITWATDENASSIVEFGLSTDYGASQEGEGNTTSHTVTISGLQESTTYNFIVKSTDAAGNQAVSEVQTLETKTKAVAVADKTADKSFSWLNLFLILLAGSGLLTLFLLWKRKHEKDDKKKKRRPTSKKRTQRKPRAR